MRDATVERLAKIIADARTSDGSPDNKRHLLPRKPVIHLHIGLAEGWFSLFLLATVVYTTIWCVQAVGWVEHINILSLTTALGLIGGVIAAKQRRLPRIGVHVIAVVLGLLIAYWQTAGAFYAGNIGALTLGIQRWIQLALSGGTSDDNSIFLFFILALGFLLAYTSAWLLYHTRRPWLIIGANAVVLLINLSNAPDGYIVFLVVFLIAALLLLLRFNLYESAQRWRRLGLRCADDLGWDFMQAGALISIGILIFSWLLPWGYTNDTAAQIWSATANPWGQVQNFWNRLIPVNGGVILANHGNFTDTLVLGGNPNLTNDEVFIVQSTEGSQYLESLNYSTYNGRLWVNGSTDVTSLKANQPYYTDASDVHSIQQTINVVNPPGEQQPYILGAPQIISVNQDAEVLISTADGSVVTFLRSNGRLAAGNHYTVVSYVSSADERTLRSIPMPDVAPTLPPHFEGQIPPNVYDPNVLKTYLQLPPALDPNILALAKQITANAPTMYDKVVALESYLRTFRYDTNISVPPGEEATSWFLFRSGHRGFCNYFATAMTVMARLLGIPARVVAGYTNGTYDPKHNQWIIRGTDAHSWTQVYFAGYGWINFEPSASFSSFTRPLPGQFGSGTDSSGLNGGQNNSSQNKLNKLNPSEDVGNGSNNTPLTAEQSQARFREEVGLTLGSIILVILFGLIFFSLWWRRLFRGYKLSAQIFGRICILANWAGVELQPSQTPYEYIHRLTEEAPEEAATLERLGDIYVRDRWADPASAEHPDHSGEKRELPGLWRGLQPRLFMHVLRHPHFIGETLHSIAAFVRGLQIRRRAHQVPEEDF